MPEVKCTTCNKIFYIKPYLLGKPRFCSRKCNGLYKKIIFQDKTKHPMWNSIKSNCKQCGKEFFVSGYKKMKGFGKYCSQKCSIETRFKIGQIAWNKGKNHLSLSARQSISRSHKGKKWTEEHRRKYYEHFRLHPRKLSDEHKRKIGEAHRKKDGRKSTGDYVYLYSPNHPNKTQEGYILEHHLVIEKEIERYVKKGECVHHINGDKVDNRIDNLVLCVDCREHNKIHDVMEKFTFNLIKSGKVIYEKKAGQFKLRENSIN